MKPPSSTTISTMLCFRGRSRGTDEEALLRPLCTTLPLEATLRQLFTYTKLYDLTDFRFCVTVGA